MNEKPTYILEEEEEILLKKSDSIYYSVESEEVQMSNTFEQLLNGDSICYEKKLELRRMRLESLKRQLELLEREISILRESKQGFWDKTSGILSKISTCETIASVGFLGWREYQC